MHLCDVGVDPQREWPIHSFIRTFTEGLFLLCFAQTQIWQVPTGWGAWGVATFTFPEHARHIPATGPLHLPFPLPRILFHRDSHHSFPHLSLVFSKMSPSPWCLPWPTCWKLQWHSLPQEKVPILILPYLSWIFVEPEAKAKVMVPKIWPVPFLLPLPTFDPIPQGASHIIVPQAWRDIPHFKVRPMANPCKPRTWTWCHLSRNFEVLSNQVVQKGGLGSQGQIPLAFITLKEGQGRPLDCGA